MAFRKEVLQLARLYTRPELAKLWGYRSHHALGPTSPPYRRYVSDTTP